MVPGFLFFNELLPCFDDALLLNMDWLVVILVNNFYEILFLFNEIFFFSSLLS